MSRSIYSLDDTDLTHPGRAVSPPSEASPDWITWGDSGAFVYDPTAQNGPWQDAFNTNTLLQRPAYRIDAGGMISLRGTSEKLTDTTQFLGSLVTTLPADLMPLGNFNYSFPVAMLVAGGLVQTGTVIVWGGGTTLPGQIRYAGPHQPSVNQLSWEGVGWLKSN